MAKKKSFGEKNGQKTVNDGSIAKVIISKKLGNNHYAFKEAMIREDNLKDYINENKD